MVVSRRSHDSASHQRNEGGCGDLLRRHWRFRLRRLDVLFFHIMHGANSKQLSACGRGDLPSRESESQLLDWISITPGAPSAFEFIAVGVEVKAPRRT